MVLYSFQNSFPEYPAGLTSDRLWSDVPLICAVSLGCNNPSDHLSRRTTGSMQDFVQGEGQAQKSKWLWSGAWTLTFTHFLGSKWVRLDHKCICSIADLCYFNHPKHHHKHFCWQYLSVVWQSSTSALQDSTWMGTINSQTPLLAIWELPQKAFTAM